MTSYTHHSARLRVLLVLVAGWWKRKQRKGQRLDPLSSFNTENQREMNKLRG